MNKKKVAVIMGSDSDFGVIKKTLTALKSFDIEYEVRVISAHRTPHIAADFAKRAYDDNFGVIIAAAGKAAHLAGFIAAYTTVPVIGIPINASLDGIDALLSTVQMPPGVPVATVSVDGAQNAAVLAALILSVNDEGLHNKILTYKQNLAKKVSDKDQDIQKLVRDCEENNE